MSTERYVLGEGHLISLGVTGPGGVGLVGLTVDPELGLPGLIDLTPPPAIRSLVDRRKYRLVLEVIGPAKISGSSQVTGRDGR